MGIGSSGSCPAAPRAQPSLSRDRLHSPRDGVGRRPENVRRIGTVLLFTPSASSRTPYVMYFDNSIAFIKPFALYRQLSWQ
jgi:hypothetical protein